MVRFKDIGSNIISRNQTLTGRTWINLGTILKGQNSGVVSSFMASLAEIHEITPPCIKCINYETTSLDTDILTVSNMRSVYLQKSIRFDILYTSRLSWMRHGSLITIMVTLATLSGTEETTLNEPRRSTIH